MRPDAASLLSAPTRWKAACAWLALAAVYVPAAAALHQLWIHHPYAGHGPLVPCYAALVLWRDRAALRAARRDGDRQGLHLVGLALFTLAMGAASGNVYLQIVSLVPAIAGMVLWLYGPICLRLAAFSIALLALMLPLPVAVVAAVTSDLQVLVADLASRVLAVVGVPFYHDGVRIELEAITLEVAEICNGLRFFMALLTLALVLAKVVPHAWMPGLVLVASSLPLALAANVVRVVAIATAVYYGGVEWASGAGHHLIGKVIWVLALAALLAWSWLIARLESRRQRMGGRSVQTAPGDEGTQMPARAGA